MIHFGRRIYFDVTTGIVIYEMTEQTHYTPAERQSVEKDIESIKVLSERVRETFDVIELEYGQYAQDFAECNGYRVNLETLELEFSYPDPNEPEAPPVYQLPLSVQIEQLKLEQAQANSELVQLIMLMSGGKM